MITASQSLKYDSVGEAGKHIITAITAESPYLLDGRQWAWDSSSLGPAKDCARKYFYQQILGYRQKGENVHLTFGRLYASALETYHKLRAEPNGFSHRDTLYNVVHKTMTASWDFDRDKPMLDSE